MYNTNIMPEDSAEKETMTESRGSFFQSSVERHQRFGGNPEVHEKAEIMQNNMVRAIDLIAGDSNKPLNTRREERVLAILTGVNFLTNDPHGLGARAGDHLISAKDSIRLANFIRAVSRLGTIDADGNVNLNLNSKEHPTAKVRVSSSTE